MNSDRLQNETKTYAAGWMRRRIARTLIMTVSLFAVGWQRGDVSSWPEQLALLVVILVCVLDVLGARRELTRVTASAPARFLVLADRELTYVKWAELIEYIAAGAIAMRLVHRSLDALYQAVIVALVAAGLFLRFGLARWAKRGSDGLRLAVETSGNTAPS